MNSAVRVRFAPSPTGPLHIGGLRTALYNYLFAKKHGGTFVLRVEDTDQKRFVEGAEQYVIESLNWCGIPFDEGPGKEGDFGPYHQSDRREIYRKYVNQLLESGNAYYAFDTPEELADLRKKYEAEGKTFSYNWETRGSLRNALALSEEEVKAELAKKTPYVIRFKPPRNEEVLMEDLVRGKIKVNSDVIDDKVLYKTDGLPTYHMANIIDDHTMEISHVIRGEEWIPSMPLHVLLYRAFGWEPPKYAHLPLILKPTGKGKLSKRDGDKMGFPVFPLEWKDPKSGEVSSGYREDGYLPQAVINMLAFLGWNPGGGSEKEIFSLEELVDAFRLKQVSKSGAKFDFEKTKWFQQQYFHRENPVDLAEEFDKTLKDKGIQASIAFVEEVVRAVQERATFPKDLWELSSFYFEAPKEFDAKAVKKKWKSGTADLMKKVQQLVDEVEEFNHEQVAELIKAWITEEGIGFGKVMSPLRLALVGKMMGPDLFSIIETLGKKETVRRLNYAITTLGA